MKKLLLILSLGLIVVGLSGCYVEPYGGHDDGYHRDHSRDRDDHEGGHEGERGDRDRYH